MNQLKMKQLSDIEIADGIRVSFCPQSFLPNPICQIRDHTHFWFTKNLICNSQCAFVIQTFCFTAVFVLAYRFFFGT